LTSLARPAVDWGTPLSVFGVAIRMHLSWLLIAALIAWSLATNALPTLHPGYGPWVYAGLSLAIVLGLGASIVVHELAHALVARSFGIRVRRITLFLLGGLAELVDEPARAAPELAMALAGPVFSVALAILLTVASGLAHLSGSPDVIAYAIAYLATLNFVVALFNLAPAFPLDGGRVLRALLWMMLKDQRRATAWSVRVSESLAALLLALGLATLFGAGVAEGLWWILIGLFVWSSARSELLELDARRTYAGHPVSDVMVRAPETVPAEMTLEEFARTRLLSARHSLYPVMRGDQWIGTLDPADVLRVPRRRWREATLAEVCTPAALAPRVRADDDAAALLDHMQRQNTLRLVVADRNRVVGLVTLQDLLQGVRLRRRFGLPAA
jgi:Zn-dependent protease